MPTFEVYFFNGNQKQAGDSLKAELTSNAIAAVDVVVENPFGEVLAEKHIDNDPASRLLKLKMEYVPAGTYRIKVHHCLGAVQKPKI